LPRVPIFALHMIKISSLLKRGFPFSITLTIILLITIKGFVVAQGTGDVVPDSLLKERLTRAVQTWKLGKPLQAYQTLDSITSQQLTLENASSKVKAAIWTATYLQEQKKLKPAVKFLDSAFTWASQYARGEELKRSYEAYANWHIANGNIKSALAAQNKAIEIKDSLTQLNYQSSLDSLNKLNADLKSSIAKQSAPSKNEVIEPSTSSNHTTIWIMGVSIFALLILVFLLNGKVQRLNSAPIIQHVKNENSAKIAVDKKEIKLAEKVIIPVEEIVVEKVSRKKGNNNADKVSAAIAKDTNALKLKLSTVELILIRADIFAEKVNGESKVAGRTLQKYVDEFPLMMKNLDDAIANNDADAILKSTVEFKTALTTFGMLATVIWIDEIEAEAPDAKINKLLSRVFQVRNHVRRALDEAKAILEKVSL